MSILKEFKEFAIKGNAIDMAIGIVVGAAFGTIVKSLVDNLLMPPIGLLLGHADFSNMYLVLRDGLTAPGPYLTPADAIKAGAVLWRYGLFVNDVISFLIISFAVFMLVKLINKLKREAPTVEATLVLEVAEEVKLLREIRDSLQSRSSG